MKIVFLETASLGDDMDLSIMKKYGEVRQYVSSSPEEVKERVRDADVVFANRIMMNEENLSGAVKLKYIGVTATGINNIDVDYVRRRKLFVTNVAGYSTDSVAQHTIAMTLYLLEKLRFFDDFVQSGRYAASGLFCCYDEKFWQLSGKTWGIIGLGAIGKRVAEIAGAFGCRVIYYSTSGKNHNSQYEQVDFDTLLCESDIVSIHAPLTDRTEGLMDYGAFSKMKKSALLINTGRGPIVREADLVRALNEGKLAAAGLDVMSSEPLPSDNPLMTIRDSRRLLLTPHIAWASVEARTLLIEELALNLEAWLNGEERNRVC